jgi:hypothetical protein
MKLVRGAAGLALLLAVTAAGAAPARKGEPGYDPNREICKSQPVIGSRLSRVRECHTAQQWEEMKREEQEALRRKQYNGASGCNECGG